MLERNVVSLCPTCASAWHVSLLCQCQSACLLRACCVCMPRYSADVVCCVCVCVGECVGERERVRACCVCVCAGVGVGVWCVDVCGCGRRW